MQNLVNKKRSVFLQTHFFFIILWVNIILKVGCGCKILLTRKNIDDRIISEYVERGVCMKKYLVLLLVLLFAITVCLTACDFAKKDSPDNETGEVTTEKEEEIKPKEPTDAASLYKKIDKKMTSMKSYQVEQKAKMVYYVYGVRVEGEVEGKAINAMDQKKDPFYYQYTSSTVKMEDFEQTESSFLGYLDGRMYLMNDNGNLNQKLFGNVEKKDFEDYNEETGLSDLEMDDCKDADFSKTKDGNWTLEFSGYTKKSIDYIVEELGFDGYQEIIDIEDLKISFEADSKYRVKSLKIEFLFDVDEGDTEVPEMIIVQDYSKYDEIDRNSVEFDTEGYKEVEDILILREFKNKLDELVGLESGKFTVDIGQTVKIDGKTASEHKEKDTIYYGKENGSFYYNLEGDLNGSKVTSTYKNGVQATSVDEESQSIPSTEAQAKEVVFNLIDCARYDPDLVSNIEKVSDGEYRFIIDYANTALYEAAFEQAGITDSYAKQVITVVLDGEKIMKIVDQLDAMGTYDTNGTKMPVEMTLVSEVVFEYVAEGQTNA